MRRPLQLTGDPATQCSVCGKTVEWRFFTLSWSTLDFPPLPPHIYNSAFTSCKWHGRASRAAALCKLNTLSRPQRRFFACPVTRRLLFATFHPWLRFVWFPPSPLPTSLPFPHIVPSAAPSKVIIMFYTLCRLCLRRLCDCVCSRPPPRNGQLNNGGSVQLWFAISLTDPSFIDPA